MASGCMVWPLSEHERGLGNKKPIWPVPWPDSMRSIYSKTFAALRHADHCIPVRLLSAMTASRPQQKSVGSHIPHRRPKLPRPFSLSQSRYWPTDEWYRRLIYKDLRLSPRLSTQFGIRFGTVSLAQVFSQVVCLLRVRRDIRGTGILRPRFPSKSSVSFERCSPLPCQRTR